MNSMSSDKKLAAIFWPSNNRFSYIIVYHQRHICLTRSPVSELVWRKNLKPDRVTSNRVSTHFMRSCEVHAYASDSSSRSDRARRSCSVSVCRHSRARTHTRAHTYMQWHRHNFALGARSRGSQWWSHPEVKDYKLLVKFVFVRSIVYVSQRSHSWRRHCI